MKRSENNFSSSGHSLEVKLFFTGPKSGTFSIIIQNFDVKHKIIPTQIDK